MRIADFEVLTVGTPPPHLGGRYWTFVVLTTDDGISGVGEAYGVPFHPRTAERMLADVCERIFVGADPLRTEKLWRIAYSRNYSQRPDGSLMACISAAETACWDIAGKALGRPVCDLLGGRVREKLRAYTYLYPEAGEGDAVYVDADLAARRAAECAEQGWTAVKFDPAGPYTAFDPRQLGLQDLARAEDFARKIREAVGTRCDLLFGTHGQMTPSGALRLARRLEPYDPLWLEEPTPPENAEAMGRVARGTRIPIAAGERLCGRHEFARILDAGAGIVQPALGRAGGILEVKKIAALAETHYAQIAPHLYCGPVEAAANIQVSLTCSNFLILEAIKDFSGFHARILKTPLQWEEGFVVPPKGPGLGVELNLEICRQNPYQGEDLHLQTSEEPL